MTNFFASCELLCEECGEVAVTNLKPIFPWEICQEILPQKKSTTQFPFKIFKFHHLELLGALLRKIPQDGPETDPKGTETDPKRTETDPNRTETDQNQALWGGSGGGLSG